MPSPHGASVEGRDGANHIHERRAFTTNAGSVLLNILRGNDIEANGEEHSQTNERIRQIFLEHSDTISGLAKDYSEAKFVRLIE